MMPVSGRMRHQQGMRWLISVLLEFHKQRLGIKKCWSNTMMNVEQPPQKGIKKETVL